MHEYTHHSVHVNVCAVIILIRKYTALFSRPQYTASAPSVHDGYRYCVQRV